MVLTQTLPRARFGGHGGISDPAFTFTDSICIQNGIPSNPLRSMIGEYLLLQFDLTVQSLGVSFSKAFLFQHLHLQIAYAFTFYHLHPQNCSPKSF